MSSIPVYFSHSYRSADRTVNDFFWQVFHQAGFSFTVDPESTALHTTVLELMMARSVGYAAVVTYRPEEETYKCSPFILYEYGLAVQARQPRLVLRDKRVPPRYFRTQDTIEVEFDAAAPDRCAGELASRLDQFRAQASGRSAWHRYRRGRVGVALASGTPGAQTRRAIVEGFLDKDGDEVIDLAAVDDDPWKLAQSADDCDFAVIDLDDARAARIADFLLGRGTPLLKLARREPAPGRPGRLLGSAPLRRAAASDQLVTYWATTDEFESQVGHQIALTAADRTELTGLEEGHRYFRSLGRGTQRVFVSNAGPANDLARDLAGALRLENIPFFHYRFQNPIGLGQQWSAELGRMIAASKIFLPVIDGSYWASDYCKQEYETAVRLEKEGQITIIPALLDGHADGPEIPYQGIDLGGLPRGDQVTLITGHMDSLLAAGAGRADGQPGLAEAGRASVDVAIITTLPEEYQAVLQLLQRTRQVSGSATLDNKHAWVIGEADAPHLPVPYTVALAICSRAGTNAAAITTNNTIEALDPRCVLVVGVAGGLGGTALGDVVVADRVCAYEYGKFDRGFHPRDDLDSPTDPALASAARTLAARHPGWFRELIQPPDLQRLSPRIVIGPVASGDKVVDDPAGDFFATISSSRAGLRAVEMEGAGAAAAVQDIRQLQRPVSFGMIRGISDLPRDGGSPPSGRAGPSAQTQMRDAWKRPAAAAAAAAAIQLIRLSWPRPPRLLPQAAAGLRPDPAITR